MMAGSVAGEAAASVALTRLLKHDETLALPPAEHEEVTVLAPPTADEDIKAKRKAAKLAKQAAWPRRRREQQARARHGGVTNVSADSRGWRSWSSSHDLASRPPAKPVRSPLEPITR